jgi:hypothetical protein
MSYSRLAFAALGAFVAYFILGGLSFALFPSLADEFRNSQSPAASCYLGSLNLAGRYYIGSGPLGDWSGHRQSGMRLPGHLEKRLLPLRLGNCLLRLTARFHSMTSEHYAARRASQAWKATHFQVKQVRAPIMKYKLGEVE